MKDWIKPEVARLRVAHGATFRVWIGLNQSFTDDDLRRRDAQQRLGTLLLPVKIGSEYREFTRQF